MLDEGQMNEAEATLRGQWKECIESEGGRCRVCDRWGKINAYVMHKNMVRSMVWMYHEHLATGQLWINVPASAPRLVTRSYSLTKLKYWGFVRPLEEEQLTKSEREMGLTRKTRKSGKWKLTDAGRDFILNNIAVPKRAFVYNDAVIKFDDELITARDSMEQDFNYDEMMQTRYDFGYNEDMENENEFDHG